MADLKPIGSERLQGQDKINRILEISRYKETAPSNINETSRVEFEKTLADGHQYEIVKEKTGYIIKKRIDESLDYIEPMKNRTYYRSYSQALKRLNLMAGEINRLVENEEEVSMYQISEQKKFTLKTPKAPAPAPMPEPAAELPPPAPAPEEGSMDAPLDDASLDMPAGDEMDMDMELDTPEGDMDIDMSSEEEPMGGEEEEITFKTIQKLTGKLGQKIRMMNDSVGMTSEDVKYVINSLLSALDLSKLDEEDQEDIMSKFEEDQESDYDSDMDMGSMGDDEDMDVDMDVDMDMEEPIEGEMEEGDVIGVYSNINKQRDEMSEEDKVNSHVAKMMDEIFSESKVDKVLTSYFQISESEKKEKKQKINEGKKIAINSIKKLSETIEQELAAEFIVRENSNYKLVGKTNKSNLVFEHNGEQIRVTPKGEVL
jgi:cell division protein ZapA (FtsZ GTPase activity inhibitor)